MRRLDLPTLLRPRKATSGGGGNGVCSLENVLRSSIVIVIDDDDDEEVGLENDGGMAISRNLAALQMKVGGRAKKNESALCN